MQKIFKTFITISLLFIANFAYSAVLATPNTVIEKQQPKSKQFVQKQALNAKKYLSEIWTEIKTFKFSNPLKAQPEETAKIDGLAVAGFICALLSLFVAGIILGLLAVIFSAIALGRIKRSEGKRRGKGLAIAGLVIGLIALVITLVYVSTL